MTDYGQIPLWVAGLIAFFLVLGSTLTVLGAVGLVRLRSFYDRIHAPTLGSSWGTAGILLASILLYSYTSGRVMVHELVIGAFIMITTPVTLMILGRTALHRDHLEVQTPPDVVWAAPGDAELEVKEREAEAADQTNEGDPAADFDNSPPPKA